MIRLYQFPISHYCEKSRWALDYKAIPYELVNLLPGPHMATTKRLAKRSSVPILDYEGEIVQDSTAILEYLEKKIPSPPLIPQKASDLKAALEWEEYCDEDVGKHLRRFFYHYLLDDPKLMPKLILQQQAWYAPYLFFFLYPGVKRVMRKSMNIYPEPTKKSEKILGEALKRLDSEVSKRDYLVADQFTRADMAACALLAPLFTPPEHDFPWPAVTELPEVLQALHDRWADSALANYVARVYRDHRKKGSSHD